jgi:hypothetical protein
MGTTVRTSFPGAQARALKNKRGDNLRVPGREHQPVRADQHPGRQEPDHGGQPGPAAQRRDGEQDQHRDGEPGQRRQEGDLSGGKRHG